MNKFSQRNTLADRHSFQVRMTLTLLQIQLLYSTVILLITNRALFTTSRADTTVSGWHFHTSAAPNRLRLCFFHFIEIFTRCHSAWPSTISAVVCLSLVDFAVAVAVATPAYPCVKFSDASYTRLSFPKRMFML